MKEILCSTGALIGKPNGRNHMLLEELSNKLNCDGFEFMMYSSWYEAAEKIVEDLQRLRINIPVMHCEKHIGEAISRNEPGDADKALSLFEQNCQIAQKLGAKKMVMHLWDGIISDQHFYNNLGMYGELASISHTYQIDLLVENVVCNKEDPMSHWLELYEKYPQIHFVFDTKMAAFHEQMDLIYDKDYQWLWEKDCIRHLHVNDYGGGYMEWGKLKTLPIGAGHIDFERFFDFINEKNYMGDFTVEATAFDRETGVVDVEMLNRCFDYIRERR
ncbi:MAG: TIM barrel protein [Lachnospiraceae bacterium]|nr:TIM barrel protein [Lachnospiraceae bacterium]